MADQDVEIVKNTKRWVKIGGIISGGLVTILTPLIVMYVEVKPQVDEASAGASSSYEAIVPAIVEMQNILNEATDWAEGTDEDLDEVMERIGDIDEMDRRLIRCETYIELLSQRSSFPRAPDLVEAGPAGMISMSFPDEPDPEHHVQQRAQYEIPKNFKNAKAKASARSAAKCSPDDPLCGGL